MLENIYTIFFISIVTVSIVIMAYYTTILIGKKSNFYLQGKSVKVLEKTIISPGFSIIAVQAIDKVHIIALQNKQMVLLDTMDNLKWQEYKQSNQEDDHNKNRGYPFMKGFEKMKSNKKGDENSNHDDT